MERDYWTVTQAAKAFPGNPHANSVRRWMHEGCYGIKLRSVRFGKKRLTTRQWCEEFAQAFEEADPAITAEHHKAQAKLAAMGI